MGRNEWIDRSECEEKLEMRTTTMQCIEYTNEEEKERRKERKKEERKGNSKKTGTSKKVNKPTRTCSEPYSLFP